MGKTGQGSSETMITKSYLEQQGYELVNECGSRRETKLITAFWKKRKYAVEAIQSLTQVGTFFTRLIFAKKKLAGIELLKKRYRQAKTYSDSVGFIAEDINRDELEVQAFEQEHGLIWLATGVTGGRYYFKRRQ